VLYCVGNQPSPDGVQDCAGCDGVWGVIGSFPAAGFRAVVRLRAAGFFGAAFLREALPRAAFFLAGALRFRAFLATLCPPLVESMAPPLSPIFKRLRAGSCSAPRRGRTDPRENSEPTGRMTGRLRHTLEVYFLIPNAAYWRGM